MKALRINPNGRLTDIEITGESIEQQNECIYKHLGGYFETVRLRCKDAILLVDDEGLLKRLPINRIAMMISSYPMLVGPALVVGLTPTEDGDVFTDCPDRYFRFADSIRAITGK